jgi:two-component system, chemotaxis family, chemotaxis protein CheY
MPSRVLVADDSGVMRKIIIRALNSLGVTEITEAANGAEAIALFDGGGFDLVLTDWNMPQSSGLDVVRHIRAAGSKVPVVLVTTEAEKARVVEAIEAGVDDYLAKPFEASALQAKLEALVAV